MTALRSRPVPAWLLPGGSLLCWTGPGAWRMHVLPAATEVLVDEGTGEVLTLVVLPRLRPPAFAIRLAAACAAWGLFGPGAVEVLRADSRFAAALAGYRARLHEARGHLTPEYFAGLGALITSEHQEASA